MKKLIACLLAMVSVLSFAACETKNKGPEDLDLSKVYTTLTEKVAIPEMLELDEDMMLDYCGIRSDDVEQAIVVICADSLRTDEIWLIEAVDEAAAKEIEALAENRLAKKGEESITYSPEQYEVVQKAELIRDGRFVALFVSPDAAQLAKIYKAEANI